MERWRVGILVFDGVAALDLAGPFEVFSRARLEPGVESRQSEASAPFDVFTVGKTRDPVTATGGLVLLPSWSFDDAPPIDLLLVPGGFGTRPLLQDAETIDWIRRTAASARRTASVCTGALLLARAGLLDGRRATTRCGSPPACWPRSAKACASIARLASSTTACSRRRASPRGWTSRSTSSRRSSGGPSRTRPPAISSTAEARDAARGRGWRTGDERRSQGRRRGP